MDDALLAVIASVPAVIAAWAAYTAARRSAQRDLAQDRQAVIQAARERAAIADSDRDANRTKLIRLEQNFDRLRSALRRVVDALDSMAPDHEALGEARDALEDLAE